MNKKPIRASLITVCIMGAIVLVLASYAQDTHDDHEGHDPAAAPTTPEAPADHACADCADGTCAATPDAVKVAVAEADHDAHAGHDHAAAPTTPETADDHACADCADGTCAAPSDAAKTHIAEAGHDDHEGHDHGDAGEEDHDTPAAQDDADHDEACEHDTHDDPEAPAAGEQAGHVEDDAHDDHAGHDHAEHADEAGGLELTAAQRKQAGIVVARAMRGSLHHEVRLPGEIVFNEDHIVHLVPRAPGVAIEIYNTLGDRVETGDVLARIDSIALAEAKLDYVTAVTEVGCCQFNLPRAQAIHDNTTALLALLETGPSAEQLRASAPEDQGAFRGQLITTYAEFALTRKEYEREQTLLKKGISSQGDFLTAESAFKKAEAAYLSTRGTVPFKARQDLLEATREQQLAALEAEASGQKLIMLGLSETDLLALANLQLDNTNSAPAAHACPDPNCKACVARREAAGQPPAAGRGADLHLGWYDIKAPASGVIVQKHITRGERVSEATEVFTVVDNNTVWANLTVYSKDLASVQRGQEVLVRADHSGAQALAKIVMLTPFVDPATRSATARVLLDNVDGRWMPGTFVTGSIATPSVDGPVIVPRDAVLQLDGEDIIFIDHGEHFEMKPVTLGRADREQVEVIAGLEPGTTFVVKGAFRLKAMVVTSTLDPHAGHGH